MVDINTTPLIDVMLVLLIMLIITIPIQLHAVNLNMPVGTPPPATEQPVVVTIDVDFDGTVYWNGEQVPSRAALEEKLTVAAQTPVQPEVHLPAEQARRVQGRGGRDGFRAASRRGQARTHRQRAVRQVAGRDAAASNETARRRLRQFTLPAPPRMVQHVTAPAGASSIGVARNVAFSTAQECPPDRHGRRAGRRLRPAPGRRIGPRPGPRPRPRAVGSGARRGRQAAAAGGRTAQGQPRQGRVGQGPRGRRRCQQDAGRAA